MAFYQRPKRELPPRSLRASARIYIVVMAKISILFTLPIHPCVSFRGNVLYTVYLTGQRIANRKKVQTQAVTRRAILPLPDKVIHKSGAYFFCFFHGHTIAK